MMDAPDSGKGSAESQQRVAAAVGVTEAERHVLLCADQTNPKCCDRERGLAAWSYLKRRLRELGLSERGGVLRTKANCLRGLRRRADCRRLPGRDVVPRVRPGGSRADSSRAI